MNLFVIVFLGISTEQTRFDFKLFAITGDIPALNLILNFTGHSGYFACHHCLARGIHKDKKRQYPFDSAVAARTVNDFLSDSLLATQSGYERGHRGQSVLLNQLDCELPHSILIDYAHTTLLRHGKLLLSKIYSRLRPIDRASFDDHLANQPFPHFFHRKLRRLDDLSFIKATEVRNILFYALIPLSIGLLPIDLLTLITLFVTAIRLLHGQPLFGRGTPNVAHDLLLRYYSHFDQVFPGHLNLTLHQHLHFKEQYLRFGSLSHTGSFGQESLIGYIGSNWQGTRFLGENICYNYSIDFALHHHPDDVSPSQDVDGPMDRECTFNFPIHSSVSEVHQRLCGCLSIGQCIIGYRRCRTEKKLFHSLSYSRRKRSCSYFVRCQDKDLGEFFFGKIVVFFMCKCLAFALIQIYQCQGSFSDLLRSSRSYFLVKNSVDRLFFLLSGTPSLELRAVSINSIVDHCIVFNHEQHLIATPVSSYDEHN